MEVQIRDAGFADSVAHNALADRYAIMLPVDGPIRELADDLYRARVRRARATRIEEKVLSGGRLFDAVRERMIWGIRAQFPHFSEPHVQAELRRRIGVLRRSRRAAQK